MKVYYCFPKGLCKALTMSYDDGTAADRRLVSIFNRYGIRGTFNLNYAYLSDTPDGNNVSKAEVAELYKGHEVATHTSHHPMINRCPLTYVADEILEDRKGLESLTGYPVRGHAYPNGSYSREIDDLFRRLGIVYGRLAAENGRFSLPENPMAWEATCHHNDPKLMEYGKYLVDYKSTTYMRVMYVWGHSYEFDRNQNWNVIEDFCKLVGGRDDIWYATNVEIIDYMEAVKRLQFNAACTAVYNPSAASVWLAVRGENIVEAKGGCYTEF